MRCLTPVNIAVTYKSIGSQSRAKLVPCGKCVGCRKNRANAWSFRLKSHMSTAKGAMFLTLTYNNEHLPINRFGKATLVKRDLQLFMKRLRKKYPDRKLSYYACGEYGGRTKRPHYHMILFGLSKYENYAVKNIGEAWSTDGHANGHVHFGDVSLKSIRYVTGYVIKPAVDNKYLLVQPEFSLMSKGLGANYLTPTMINHIRKNFIGALTMPNSNGHLIAIPRYYRLKCFQLRTPVGTYKKECVRKDTGLIYYRKSTKWQVNYNEVKAYKNWMREIEKQREEYRQHQEALTGLLYGDKQWTSDVVVQEQKLIRKLQRERCLI